MIIIKVFVTETFLELVVKGAAGFVIFILNCIAPVLVQRWYEQEIKKPASSRNQLAKYMSDESVKRLRPSRTLAALLIIYLTISGMTLLVNDDGLASKALHIFEIESIDKDSPEVPEIEDTDIPQEENEEIEEPDPYWFTQYILRMTTEEVPIDELEQFDTNTLSYLRNGLYAVHSKIFKDEKNGTYFSQFGWYQAMIPDEYFSDSCFNTSERKNIDNIVHIEDSR